MQRWVLFFSVASALACGQEAETTLCTGECLRTKEAVITPSRPGDYVGNVVVTPSRPGDIEGVNTVAHAAELDLAGMRIVGESQTGGHKVYTMLTTPPPPAILANSLERNRPDEADIARLLVEAHENRISAVDAVERVVERTSLKMLQLATRGISEFNATLSSKCIYGTWHIELYGDDVWYWDWQALLEGQCFDPRRESKRYVQHLRERGYIVTEKDPVPRRSFFLLDLYKFLMDVLFGEWVPISEISVRW
jgi:hypothetical protein